MKRSFLAAMLSVLSVACLSATLAYGQQGGRGQINGTVTDSSRAVIPGARVTITNTLTGQITTVSTTSDGNYSVPFLQPGKYTASASRDGFDSETQTDLTLTADQITAANFVLKPGASTTRVEVQASATQIDTTSGALSQVIDQKTITELPLNGRNPATLVALAPGAVDGTQVYGIALPGPGSGSPAETGAVVNGSRIGGILYQLDGITHMNNYFQTANPFPNPDATQEFRVITNNFDVQYGYTAGSVVSIATRSGTNQWHGVGFEFLRNNVLNARDYFTRTSDPLKWNQFGGSVGGPIIKNKLFIFGNVQFTRTRISASGSGSSVPNNRQLAGDFSQICASGFDLNGVCNDRVNGQVVNQLYKSWNDHTLDNIYPNNFVDPSTFSTFSTTFEQGLPKTDEPNGQVIVSGIVIQNNAYEYTTRVDYNITPNQVLSGNAFYDNYSQPTTTLEGSYLGAGRSVLDQVLTISLSHIWTIRPNLINDLRGGYSKNNSQALTAIKKVGGGDLTFKALGSNLNQISDLIGQVYDGGFAVQGIPVIQGRHDWSALDTISLTKGKHSLSAGFSFVTNYSFEQATWGADPIAWFLGNVTGDSVADFLLGLVNNLWTSGGEYNLYTSKNVAAFAQDTFKLRPDLTVNFGLRWEPQIAPVSLLNHMADYYPGEQSVRYPNAPKGLVYPGDPGVPQGGWANRWNTLLPRVSIAYAPRPTTTVRAAFGMMSLPYDYSFYNHQSANAPFSPLYLLTNNQVGNCTLNILDPFACYAPTGFKDPFPPFAGPDFRPGPDTAFATPNSMEAVFTPGFQPQKEETWNFSIQHSLKNNFLFTVAYVGHHDYHNPVPIQLSPGIFNCVTLGPNCTQEQINANGTPLLLPTYTSVLAYESIGGGNYNGVQVSVQKQFSRGLQFTSNYTYSKSLDDNSTPSLSAYQAVFDPYDLRANYGVSDSNTPQIWNNTFVYQTPKLAGLGTFRSGILGNWEIAGSWQLHSGQPLIIGGGDNPAAPGAGGDNASYSNLYEDRADRIPGVPLKVHQGGKANWLLHYFNSDAFTYNAPGTFGNSGRGVMYGPGWNIANLMFAKNFPFRERYSVQFRWEMFNAFNRTGFGTPAGDFTPSATGGFGEIFGTATSPRAMQAGLKINF